MYIFFFSPLTLQNVRATCKGDKLLRSPVPEEAGSSAEPTKDRHSSSSLSVSLPGFLFYKDMIYVQ